MKTGTSVSAQYLLAGFYFSQDFYFNERLCMSSSEGLGKSKSKTGGETYVRINVLCGITNLVPSSLIFFPMYCFHPDF
jgi:hypothetical protein